MMRVLLVTWTEQLLEKLSVLNPALEYCAIVTDEVDSAKKILGRVGLPQSLVHSLYDLKEYVDNCYYDYILCAENGMYVSELSDVVQECNPKEKKLLRFDILNSQFHFLVERSLRYFKEHAAAFEMFATGISYVEVGLDVTRFKRKLFNFAHSAQDLYYNFQVAKTAILCGGGHNKIKYALIGLAPYSFHYDQSKASGHYRLLQYFIAFNDLHNFHVKNEDYRKFFREEYLATKLPLEQLDLNNPYLEKTPVNFMTKQKKLEAYKAIYLWAKKNYPETCAENVKILDDYLTLCEENNIRPIMFLPPMTEGYMKHFNRQMLDEFYYLVRQACRKHRNAIFIDGWKLQGMTDVYFCDYGHMNLHGAAMFSTLLNNVIEQLEG